MKKVSVNLLTNVILLLAGIILIVFHGTPNVLLWCCRVMGSMFLLPAIAYLVMVAVRHADARKSADYLGVLPAVGGLCFGIVMIVKPGKFDEILQLLMGVLLVVLGLFHIIYPVAHGACLARERVHCGAHYRHLPAAVQLHQPAGIPRRAPCAQCCHPTC